MKFKDLAVLLVALAVALFAIACGSDQEGSTDTESEVAASTAPGSSADADEAGDGESDEGFSAAVAAADPEEATACLEREGFTVTVEDSMPDEMVEATGIEQILTLTGEMGAGSVSYYASEDDALLAHEAELDNQVPDTVIGRTERAVYAFSGSDNSAATRAIEGCV